METTSKTTSKGLTQESLENMSRGRNTEVEQLKNNNLEKNNKPIEVTDPKTGKPGTTVPDAFTNEGKSTFEIKKVKTQGLTEQLRLQEKFSNDNGLKPELIINEGAHLTKPLLESSFKITKYSILPATSDATYHKAPPVDISTPTTSDQFQ